MACVVCGAETKGRALLCERCFGRMEDPLSLLPSALDPTADVRLNQVASVCLRIGPASTGDLNFSKGMEPALRLREIMSSESKDQMPVFVDRFLAGLGIGLRLRGDERLPRRGIVWSMLQGAREIEFEGEVWARASTRMGNVEALLVREAMRLPIERSASVPFAQSHADAARRLYERGSHSPSLERIVLVNGAVLLHFQGDTEEALRALDGLLSSETSDSEKTDIRMWKAWILADEGRNTEALQVLEDIPPEAVDYRIRRVRRVAGGKE